MLGKWEQLTRRLFKTAPRSKQLGTYEYSIPIQSTATYSNLFNDTNRSAFSIKPRHSYRSHLISSHRHHSTKLTYSRFKFVPNKNAIVTSSIDKIANAFAIPITWVPNYLPRFFRLHDRSFDWALRLSLRTNSNQLVKLRHFFARELVDNEKSMANGKTFTRL